MPITKCGYIVDLLIEYMVLSTEFLISIFLLKKYTEKYIFWLYQLMTQQLGFSSPWDSLKYLIESPLQSSGIATFLLPGEEGWHDFKKNFKYLNLIKEIYEILTPTSHLIVLYWTLSYETREKDKNV